MKQIHPCVQLVPDYSIQLLTEKEIENPYPVLEGFFASNPFYEVREKVERLSIRKSKKIKRKGYQELSFLNSRLLKLIEAAHIINERNKLEKTMEPDQI